MYHNYQLKIELLGSNPPVWRRVLVPWDLFFSDLHDIIQIITGMQPTYFFQFKIKDVIIRQFDDATDVPSDDSEMDAVEVTLDEILIMNRCIFRYINDSGEYNVIVEEIHPLHNDADPLPVCIEGEGQLGKDGEALERVIAVNTETINTELRRYMDAWKEIYNGATMSFPEDEDDDIDYAVVSHLRSPSDVLKDGVHKASILLALTDALRTESSEEAIAFARLRENGLDEEGIIRMIEEVLAIEKFYELKYGTTPFNDRYTYNLNRLPESPAEIPSIDFAIWVLNNATRGIPFAAIDFLYRDPSVGASRAVVSALTNFSDHQYCWEDCELTPIWYAMAAEGHISEELIKPVIGFYKENNENETDLLNEQGQYLIGMLAQKYPDAAAEMVLTAMEEAARDGSDDSVYFLFDVFSFCEIDKYKDRLLALLERDDLFWHDALASTIGYLQIKEALPILIRQAKRLQAEKPSPGSTAYSHLIEIDEAITQLETGEDLFPDVNAPLCLKRGPWKEEYADAEDCFYASDSLSSPSDIGEFHGTSGIDQFWSPLADQQPIIKAHPPGRNDPCYCGSGKKYKKCCLDKDNHIYI
jgi:hypothetical protein